MKNFKSEKVTNLILTNCKDIIGKLSSDDIDIIIKAGIKIFDDGYDDGCDEGYENGYDDGFENGYDEGTYDESSE